MSSIVGIDLSTDVVRAIAVGRWRQPRTFEIAWDPSRPADAVSLLRAQFGPATRIAISVGLGFLHPKHVSLPPAPVAARRRMLALEPDRFFPVQGEPVVVSALPDSDVAFAADAAAVQAWIEAFEAWAPVETIEPAPASLARALGDRASGSYVVPSVAGETGVLELRAGKVQSARRIPGEAGRTDTVPLPNHGRVPAPFLAAYGAARGIGDDLAAALLPDAHAARIRGRRIRRTATSAVACVVALLTALWAWDRSRERTLERIRGEVALLETRAETALAMRDQLAALDVEIATLRDRGRGRADPLHVLAALSERLPTDVTVLVMRASGEDWQVDGTARDAATILPLLDGDDRFEGVRFLSATARFREGNRTYETFSIAFRVRPED